MVGVSGLDLAWPCKWRLYLSLSGNVLVHRGSSHGYDGLFGWIAFSRMGINFCSSKVMSEDARDFGLLGVLRESAGVSLWLLLLTFNGSSSLVHIGTNREDPHVCKSPWRLVHDLTLHPFISSTKEPISVMKFGMSWILTPLSFLDTEVDVVPEVEAAFTTTKRMTMKMMMRTNIHNMCCIYICRRGYLVSAVWRAFSLILVASGLRLVTATVFLRLQFGHHQNQSYAYGCG